MLQLTKDYDKLLSLIESIDITDRQQIYDVMDLYENCFLGESLQDKELLQLMESGMKKLISDTFDFNDPNFDENVLTCETILHQLSRTELTEPIFKLLERAFEIIDDNKILTSSQEVNCSDCNYPLDSYCAKCILMD